MNLLSSSPSVLSSGLSIASFNYPSPSGFVAGVKDEFLPEALIFMGACLAISLAFMLLRAWAR